MSAPTQASDEDLLQRSRAGDEAAFSALYERRQGGLFRFALRMTGSAAVAEDVVQEVFMALIAVGCRYDPAQGPLSAFLYGVARNHVRKHFERAGRQVELVDTGGDDSTPATARFGWEPELQLARLESASVVRAAVMSLPEVHREVVVLVELEGLTYVEAAEALRCAVGTVRSRLHRARRVLAEKLRRGGVEILRPEPAGRVP